MRSRSSSVASRQGRASKVRLCQTCFSASRRSSSGVAFPRRGPTRIQVRPSTLTGGCADGATDGKWQNLAVDSKTAERLQDLISNINTRTGPVVILSNKNNTGKATVWKIVGKSTDCLPDFVGTRSVVALFARRGPIPCRGKAKQSQHPSASVPPGQNTTPESGPSPPVGIYWAEPLQSQATAAALPPVPGGWRRRSPRSPHTPRRPVARMHRCGGAAPRPAGR